MKNVVTAISLSLLLGACSTAPKTASNAGATTAPQAVQSSTAADTSSTDAQQLAALEQQSIYFDFDKSVVKADYRDTARKEADWLRSHDKDVVTLQGNTDDRGSTEYNLALGERRARSVQQTLVALGVPSSRIKDVSLGESKPRATCEEEKCWQENRRVDFMHGMN